MLKVNKVIDKYLLLHDNEERKTAAKRIRFLLSKIDQNAEAVPENNREMLSRLVGSLKGSELNSDEQAIIFEIVNS